MTLAAHLIHTCTIRRSVRPAADAHGAQPPTWATIRAGQACRLAHKRSTVFDNERAEWMPINQPILMLPAGVDVAEKDRIENVNLGAGRIVAGPFEVESLLRRSARAAHHITLGLRLIGQS